MGRQRGAAVRPAATVEDVFRLADQGKRYELIDGRLVEMAPVLYPHGRHEAWIGHVLLSHVLPRDLGDVLVGEPLFRLDPAGQLARAPDVAFVRRERVPPAGVRAFDGAPDLAVEVVSPSNRAGGLRRKVRDWLDHGAIAVLLVYPDQRRVALTRAQGTVELGEDDEVDLDPPIDGLRLRVGALFPPPR